MRLAYQFDHDTAPGVSQFERRLDDRAHILRASIVVILPSSTITNGHVNVRIRSFQYQISARGVLRFCGKQRRIDEIDASDICAFENDAGEIGRMEELFHRCPRPRPADYRYRRCGRESWRRGHRRLTLSNARSGNWVFYVGKDKNRTYASGPCISSFIVSTVRFNGVIRRDPWMADHCLWVSQRLRYVGGERPCCGAILRLAQWQSSRLSNG